VLLIPALTALAVLAPATPCTEPVRAVRCPDLVMRRPYGLRELRSPKGRHLLAATNAIVNVGEGPLEIRATRKGTGPRMTTRQVLRPRPGAQPVVLPPSGSVEYFDTRTRGTYWKYHGAARFTLRPIAADGTVGPVRRTGPKVDYCFRDLRRVRRLDARTGYDRSPQGEQFGACSTSAGARRLTLGTSVGWADIYPSTYPLNWIDVTGLRGCFAYSHTVDPGNELAELREDNNTGTTVVRLPWKGSGARGCPAPVEG
jgi:hypothetical protein